MKVTNEIKSDLMKDKPMDRLLCGDVGFGKTEVAIRAAFKVVSASKQVAVLAPTTILADQHFAVFSRRLRDFPIKAAMLSRLVTKKQQKEILKQLASGEIDIIIGTHRILSQDVSFKDLGLLIIDEEHRFGVRAKEKLKFLKTSVDVLSLSATPLPRTLYLSLSGIRDLSILRTPPKSRLPILTEILYFDKKFIKESILRELSRGGQVYFIHNDISTLPRITQTFKELLPDIPIAYAHGQMKERELDEIMHGFVEGNISVLFTTSIIESGIDIPNANTIFINMAHRFGLADLYQLRGRVGRGSRQGFAYLIIPHISQLKPEAIRKLETITKYTSLGSGYQLALNDLEIRGIGNIFGTEQSGNIQAIGYNLYMKILQEALEKIKRGEELSFNEALESDQFFTEVLFPFSSFIPENYIESQSMRFYFYQKMSNCRELEELEKVESEIKDIFGKYPPEVNGLFELHRLRILGEKLRLKKISLSQPITLIWHESVFKAFSLENLLSGLKSICQRVGYSYKISGVNTPTLTLFIKRSSNIVQDVKLFLISLIQTVKL
ncbi:MAG: helicase-related protein [Candidatus Jordarchaeaceae archaeon]